MPLNYTPNWSIGNWGPGYGGDFSHLGTFFADHTFNPSTGQWVNNQTGQPASIPTAANPYNPGGSSGSNPTNPGGDIGSPPQNPVPEPTPTPPPPVNPKTGFRLQGGVAEVPEVIPEPEPVDEPVSVVPPMNDPVVATPSGPRDRNDPPPGYEYNPPNLIRDYQYQIPETSGHIGAGGGYFNLDELVWDGGQIVNRYNQGGGVPPMSEIPYLNKGGDWEIKPENRGKLRARLGTPEGQKIPVEQLRKAAKSSDESLRKQAQYALNVQGLNQGGKVFVNPLRLNQGGQVAPKKFINPFRGG